MVSNICFEFSPSFFFFFSGGGGGGGWEGKVSKVFFSFWHFLHHGEEDDLVDLLTDICSKWLVKSARCRMYRCIKPQPNHTNWCYE